MLRDCTTKQMKRIILFLLTLVSLSAMAVEGKWLEGKGKELYDDCLQTIKVAEGEFESMSDMQLAQALLCGRTHGAFFRTLLTTTTDATRKTMASEWLDFVLVEVMTCNAPSLNGAEFAYQITDYIRDNPDYRDKAYSEAIWEWTKEYCELEIDDS